MISSSECDEDSYNLKRIKARKFVRNREKAHNLTKQSFYIYFIKLKEWAMERSQHKERTVNVS